jgi:hypothetical protein
VAACAAVPSAARAQKRAEALLSNRPPPRSGCTVAGRIPTLSSVADSAALMADLTGAAAQMRVQGDSARILLSIVYDNRGSVTRVVPIDYFLPEGTSDRLASLVRASLKPGTEERSFRMLVQFPAAGPVVRMGSSEVCKPLGLERIHVILPAFENMTPPSGIRIHVVVGPQGELMESHLVSTSGNREWDDYVLRATQAARYAAGLIDGIASTMGYEQSVSVRSNH